MANSKTNEQIQKTGKNVEPAPSKKVMSEPPKGKLIDEKPKIKDGKIIIK